MPSDKFVCRRLDDVTVMAVLNSELTSEIGEALAELLEQDGAPVPMAMVLDLSQVKFLCSVSLGVLVRLLKHVRQSGGRMAISGLDGQCRKVLEVTGLGRVFSLHSNVEEAAWSLRQQAANA